MYPITQSPPARLARVGDRTRRIEPRARLRHPADKANGPTCPTPLHPTSAPCSHLSSLTSSAPASLGVTGPVRAELYKLLVYQPGDFFTAHRDTEKARGMFATLVVALPSDHEGGELVIRHDGREATLDLSDVTLGELRWAAFYTDCEHELRPVRSGWRVALVYNLVLSKGRAPRVPDDRPTVAGLVKGLRAWAADVYSPVKLVYPLTHRYSPAELAFATLKNEDAAVADVLAAAADEADCVLRLAMVSVVESGSAEPVWSPRPGRRWGYRRFEESEESEEYEVIEVHERSQTLGSWLRPDDTVESLGAIPYLDGEVSPPDALADEDPDEDHFHEATGNEGGSFERTYRRAALVLWPSSRELAVVHQGGPTASVGVLERLLDEGATARAHAMAVLVVDGWARPDPDRLYGRGGRGGHDGRLGARLITALTRLEDTTPLRRFLTERVAAGAFDGTETDALGVALPRLDPATAGDVLARIVTSCTASRCAAVASLLARIGTPCGGAILVPALEAMCAALPQVGGSKAWWQQDARAEARIAVLGDLARAVAHTADPSLGAALSAAVLAAPDRWPLDGIVLPAVLAFPKRGNPAARALTAPLRDACRAHLQARIALPLEPPTDARRSTAGLTCRCSHCASLRDFLDDATRTSWTLKAVKHDREHVETAIRAARSELDMHTETRGSPHRLVCTKNRARYEARVRQRAEDLAALQTLG